MNERPPVQLFVLYRRPLPPKLSPLQSATPEKIPQQLCKPDIPDERSLTDLGRGTPAGKTGGFLEV